MNICLRYVKIICRKDIHFMFLGVLFALLLRLLKPIKTIRIARWNLASRIGHLICESDIYLAEKKWKCSRDLMPEIAYLYYVPGNGIGNRPLIPNQYVYDQIKRKIPSLKYSRIIEWADFVNKKIFKESSIKAFGLTAHLDERMVSQRVPSPYTQNKTDIKKAESKLKYLGVNKDKPILLFFNRDSAYIKKYLRTTDDAINDHRNSSIKNYIPMATYFSKMGYSCFRMGAETEEKIFENKNSSIVDFSLYPRDELLEFYLFSRAKFTVSDQTGLLMLPVLFRKPVVIVNEPALLSSVNPNGYFHPVFNSIIIFKKNYSLLENRLLTVSDISAKGLLHSYSNEDYMKNKVKLIDNTPEEIQEAALEMHKRLNGEWVETEEDIILQHRFWNQFNVKRDFRFLSLYPRVGANFLRNNEWLLK